MQTRFGGQFNWSKLTIVEHFAGGHVVGWGQLFGFCGTESTLVVVNVAAVSGQLTTGQGVVLGGCAQTQSVLIGMSGHLEIGGQGFCRGGMFIVFGQTGQDGFTHGSW